MRLQLRCGLRLQSAKGLTGGLASNWAHSQGWYQDTIPHHVASPQEGWSALTTWPLASPEVGI